MAAATQAIDKINVDNYVPKHRLELLNKQASQIDIEAVIPPNRYIRSSMEIMRMAKTYQSEGSYEPAFVLYQKYISLIIEHLPKHPGYHNLTPADRKNSKKMCSEALSSAEKIKPVIMKKYDMQYQKLMNDQAERLRLLKIEQDKHEAAERAKREQAEARRIQEEAELKRKATEEEDHKFALAVQKEIERSHVEPSAPPSDSELPPSYGSADAPPPPAYAEAANHPLVPTPSPIAPTPHIDRSLKPAHFTHTDSDVSNNKYGLKTVIVPSTLAMNFANYAKSNTVQNNETCGFLYGKLVQGCFRVSHVFIPKQIVKPDRCETLQEEELFEFQEKFDLIALGWIHTHPTQTAFLSSVDLHMSVSFQLMMPEAIAIVVSNKFNEVGTFQLTPNYGVNYVAKCQESGFHKHSDNPPLFQECEHVKLDNSYQAVFKDLRT